MDIFVSQKF